MGGCSSGPQAKKKSFEFSLFGNDTFPSALLTEMLLVGVTQNS